MFTLSTPGARRLLLPLVAACAVPVTGLFAGPATPEAKDKNPVQSVLDEITPLNTLNIETSYVGESSFKTKKFDGRGAGTQLGYDDQGEIQSEIEYGHRFHLTGRVYLKLGVEYERFDFGQTFAPVPTSLQNISGVVAVEYLVHGKAAAFISSKPGVYYSDFDDIRYGSFDAPTNIGAIIPLSKKFYFLVGARVSILAKYPVFPLAGVVWYISDTVRLEAIPPEPRLIVSLGDHLEVFAGGEILGGAYKRDYFKNARPQDARFRGAIINYSEVRAGAGITYKPCKQVGVDLSGGWDLGRNFDYYRGDSTKEFKTHGAPYAKVAISATF